MNILSQLASGFTDFLSRWWLIIALVVLLIVMYAFNFKRRKDYTNQMQDMLNSLRPGDKIKTVGGFYGTIVSIKETTDGKVVLLEMGEGAKVSYMSIDANAIYGVDKKQDIVYDKDGNVIEPVELADSNDDDNKKGEGRKKQDADVENTKEQQSKDDKTQQILEEEAKDIEQINNPKQEEKEEKPEKQKPINEDESKLEDFEKLIGGK